MTLKPIKSMVNTYDINTSFSALNNEEQIIDSYELLESLIIDLEGQGTIRFKRDIILPFIKGNPSNIEKAFKEFLVKAMSLFQGQIETIEIIHIRNRHSWIFGLLVQGLTSGQSFKEKKQTKKLLSELKLVLSKK